MGQQRPMLFKDFLYKSSIFAILALYGLYYRMYPEEYQFQNRIDKEKLEEEIEKKDQEFERLYYERAAAIKRRAEGYKISDYEIHLPDLFRRS